MTWRHAVVGLLLLLPAGTAWGDGGDGDDLAWVLPTRSAALYDRAWNEDTGLQGGRFNWHRPHNPPVLLSGELDAQHQHVDRTVADLRDLPAFLAFDLRYATAPARVTIEATDLRLFRPARIHVQYGPVDDTGCQRILAFVRPGAADPDARRRQRIGIAGQIRLSRTIDAAAGRVTAFESRIDARLEPASVHTGCPSRLVVDERWTWRELLQPSDARFRKRVGKAIRDGAAFLRQRLERSTYAPGERFGPAPPEEDAWRWRGPGYLALVLLAVLKSEIDPTDPAVAKAMDVLRKHDVRTTYSLACAIMALETLYAPKRERERLIAGELKEPAPRTLTEGDLALVRMWTRRLVENHDTSVDTGYLIRWRYYTSADYDNSNTQYAILGLWSARLCGVDVPPHLWLSATRHWLADVRPCEAEAPLRLRVATHAELRARKKEKGGTRTAARRRDIALSGWGYHRRDPVDGSMTAAGVTALTLCRAALGRRGQGARKLGSEVDRAIDGGRAWLARHFDVRAITGTPHGLCSRHYYLFGVERAMELAGIAHLQDRDWYFEGAVWLLETQDESGRWEGDADTAFGLLFLKKAVLPVITPRR